MSDSSPQPPQRVPAEPLRRIDWLAVAPWLILLRAPRAAFGWPLVIGTLGSVLLGGFDVLVTYEGDWPAIRESAGPSWGLAFQVAGWMALGLVISRLTAPTFSGLRGQGIREALACGLRGLPTALLATAAMLAPPAVALAVLSAVTGWGLASVSTGVAGPALLAAFPLVAAILLVVVGSPLTLGAIAVERADAYDAASRTIAYTTQRLGHAAFYTLVAIAIGCAAAAPLELLIRVAQSWLAGVTPGAPGLTSELIADNTGYAVRALRGFYPAYFFSATTAIYLLLRRDVDGQAIDEVPHADA